VIWHHKGSVAILFWDEKRLWLGNGGLKCENSVPKFELDFCPDHWGSFFGLKLHESSSHVILTRVASEKEQFKTFAPSTTSGILLK
jgi:hypothetical protein